MFDEEATSLTDGITIQFEYGAYFIEVHSGGVSPLSHTTPSQVVESNESSKMKIALSIALFAVGATGALAAEKSGNVSQAVTVTMRDQFVHSPSRFLVSNAHASPSRAVL